MKLIKLISLCIILVLLTGCNSFYWKEGIAEKCIKEKWIKSSSNDEQKYLIGMESGEVYQITDSLFKWQFRSSDIYNQIDVDKCYEITSFGWRMGFLSTYKVIYEVKDGGK